MAPDFVEAKKSACELIETFKTQQDSNLQQKR